MQHHDHSPETTTSHTAATKPQQAVPIEEHGTIAPQTPKWTRQITNRLYDCPPDGTTCVYRQPYANIHYCSWLLNNFSQEAEPIPPCAISKSQR